MNTSYKTHIFLITSALVISIFTQSGYCAEVGEDEPQDMVAPILVNGFVTYVDRSADGSYIIDTKPLPHIMMEIWQDRTGLGSNLKRATVYTDENGYYSTYVDPEVTMSWIGGNYFARIFSVTQDGCYIKEPFGSPHMIETGRTGLIIQGQSTTIPDTLGLDDVVWNIAAVCEEEKKWFADSTTIAYPPDGYKRSQVTIDYPSGSSAYSPIYRSMRIDGLKGWDDNHTQHEYAHAIMDEIRGIDITEVVWLVGHYPDDAFYPTHAFAEGWAEFIQCAIDNRAVDLFHDQYLEGSNYYAYNIERNHWELHQDNSETTGNIMDDFDGDWCEGSIASIFWDIYDNQSAIDVKEYLGSGLVTHYSDNVDILDIDCKYTSNDELTFEESMSMDMNAIYEAMYEYTWGISSVPVASIDKFWDGWFSDVGTTASARNTPDNLHWMKAIYYNHGVLLDSKGYPENAPSVSNFNIVSTPSGPFGIYSTFEWIDFEVTITESDPEDMDYLRVRLEYENPPGSGNWVEFHERDINQTCQNYVYKLGK